MKKNILSIAKTAMKHFFDIDPVITEHLAVQAIAQASVLQNGVKNLLQHKATESRTRVISLLHLSPRQSWSAA